MNQAIKLKKHFAYCGLDCSGCDVYIPTARINLDQIRLELGQV